MELTSAEAANLVGRDLFGQFSEERKRLDRIDNWLRWDHDKPHAPKQSTTEYQELAARAVTPWLDLVVTAVCQSLYVEGYRTPSDPENAEPWAIWQANGLDARQIAVHRAAVGYGYSFVTVLPGQMPDGTPMPTIRGASPRRMLAFYEEPAQDDWPAVALRVRSGRHDDTVVWFVDVFDDKQVHHLRCGEDGTGMVVHNDPEAHGVGYCPVVRFANKLDLDGRADGEVEPYISVAARIDQTAFDRLVVQRFASWVVRTIAGMNKPENQAEAQAEKLRLAAESILVASDPDTKFGSLPATPLDGFISAYDADIRTLAAVTQTPPHHLLGQMANLSAEALAAAEAGLSRKVEERKHTFGESWEQVLRLAALVAGDTESATDYDAQVRWRDMESRSLAQAADALGKIAQMLGMPAEVLWEKLPGFTQGDIEQAKALAAQGGGIDALLRQLVDGQVPADTQPTSSDPDDLRKRADAMGVLIRAGVDPEDAARQAGLDGVQFTGAVPVSLRLPEQQAQRLEG